MKVYVSSTFVDLQHHRATVAHILRMARYEVRGMEVDGAYEERPLDRCLEEVRLCDAYVGVFAWRYGFVPEGHDRSITELEYEAAGEASIPRSCFLLSEDAPWPDEHREGGAGAEQVRRFRERVRLAHGIREFATADELAGLVVASLVQAQARALDAGVAGLRREAGAAASPAAPLRVVNRRPLETPAFVDRTAQKAALHDFLFDDDVRMVSVIGRAGIGKTALACEVLATAEPGGSGPSGLDGVVYLNPRSVGFGLERIQADIARMLDQDAAAALARDWSVSDASVAEKAAVLVQHMPAGNVVVLLDGADAQLDDDGTFIEEGLRELVAACLGDGRAARIVVTARTTPVVAAGALASTRAIELDDGLTDDDAAELLRRLDPQRELGLADAEPEVLRRAAAVTHGIPRALEAIAGILDRDPGVNLGALIDDGTVAGSVEDVVAEGYSRLEDDDQRVMEALAVLVQAADPVAVTFMLHPWFPGIDVGASLRRLVRAHFAAADRRTGTYALQTLDRVHAYGQLAAGAAKESAVPGAPPYALATLERRAGELFAGLRLPPERWRSLADVAPQVAEFGHRVRAGDVDTALELLATIDAEHLFLWGHFTLLIELRSSVLGLPARPDLRAANLAGLALVHQVIGRYDEAFAGYDEAMTIAAGSGDRAAEGQYRGNLGRLHRNLGRMHEAIEAFTFALASAESADDRRGAAFWLDRLCLGRRAVGQLDEATAAHDRALESFLEVGDRRGEGASLSNIALVHVARGRWSEAEQALHRALEAAREIGDRRGVAICVGRLGQVALGTGDLPAATARYDEALALTRELGDRREESYQLLGLGRVAMARGGDALTVAREHLLAARALDVPDTNCHASACIAVVLTATREPAPDAVADALLRTDELLGRCADLYEIRFTRATALVADALLRQGPMDAALAEYDRALALCSARGAVEEAQRDLRLLASFDGAVPAVERLAQAITGAPP